jgi:outer membrane protein OmpA-like peptidoglycan-associated protein
MKALRATFVLTLLVSSTVLLAGCCPGGWMGGGSGGNGGGASGAIRGAGVGGKGGAAISRHMDDQADEMRRDLRDAEIEREGEGIKITFDSGILFETNSAELQPSAKENIRNLAKVLNKYPDTDILIEGDTDSTGTEAYNQDLSERRAGKVAGFMKELNVAGSRISTVGFGETRPIATNATEEGRRQNRRVEIAIFAGAAMRKAAASGKLD